MSCDLSHRDVTGDRLPDPAGDSQGAMPLVNCSEPPSGCSGQFTFRSPWRMDGKEMATLPWRIHPQARARSCSTSGEMLARWSSRCRRSSRVSRWRSIVLTLQPKASSPQATLMIIFILILMIIHMIMRHTVHT
jgi:hypothetical protein